MRSATIGERANALYESKLRFEIETEENIGKVAIMDVDSGDYEIGDKDGITAAKLLHERRPNGALFGIRVGCVTADSFAGGLDRRSR